MSNHIHLIGKIASVFTERRVNGKDGSTHVVATFLLAVRRPVKDGAADFVRIEVWDRLALNLMRFNAKGSRISVDGRIRSQFYNKDGATKGGELRYSVRASSIEFLSPPKAGNEGAEESAAAAPKGSRR
jgi:single-stranded DNA-binding protein